MSMPVNKVESSLLLNTAFSQYAVGFQLKVNFTLNYY